VAVRQIANEGLAMLQSFASLKRMSIGATDGEIGHVRDAYFDDHEWTLRYLVVNPGSWLAPRLVLISPWSIRDVDWQARRVNVALTREQVRNSPGIDTDQPVSRQHETAYFDYYGYPYYWTGPFAWGPVPFPREIAEVDAARRSERRDKDEKGDPNLRSAAEVHGYGIEAVDGSIGHVDDFIFNDETWGLRYFVVDTRKWLQGRHVLISTEWVERVSWEKRKAYVALTREEVRNSPEYDPESFTATDADAFERHFGTSPQQPGARTRPGSRGSDDWELPI
jgi:hypothetical protein